MTLYVVEIVINDENNENNYNLMRLSEAAWSLKRLSVVEFFGKLAQGGWGVKIG